jgi:hypothetical protein
MPTNTPQSRLPTYSCASLQGPTGVAKKTMPSKHCLDSSFKYVHSTSTDIRKRFKTKR